MKSIKQVLPIVALTVLVVFYITGFNRKSDADMKDKAFNYSFTVKGLEGNRVDFTTYKDKVIFLNLWATWCGPCRVEMPSIQKLYEKTQSEDIVFVMLALDKDGEEPKIRNYIEKNNFTFPVVMPSGGLSAQLNVPTIPTTFIISKEGKIVHQKIGTTNYDTEKYRKMLQDLAAQ